MTHLSIVIPVLNESLLIEELLRRVKLGAESITNDYEIIVVDDGSTDETWSQLEVIAHEYKNVIAIKLSRNFGHHYALTAGIHLAKGQWVIVMDGDLQDRPEVFVDLYERAQQGFDVVFVSRLNRHENIAYRQAQKLFYLILNMLSGLNLNSKQANFSIISRKVVEAFKCFPEHYRYYGATIKWMGFRTSTIASAQGLRFAGKPSYTIKKRFKLAADIIFSYSEKPLKVTTYFGIFVSLTSLFGIIWILIAKIFWGFEVIGWTSLMVSIWFLSGTILTVLGILGLYIGRIYQEVKNRPLYVISDTLNLH